MTHPIIRGFFKLWPTCRKYISKSHMYCTCSYFGPRHVKKIQNRLLAYKFLQVSFLQIWDRTIWGPNTVGTLIGTQGIKQDGAHLSAVKINLIQITNQPMELPSNILTCKVLNTWKTKHGVHMGLVCNKTSPRYQPPYLIIYNSSM